MTEMTKVRPLGQSMSGVICAQLYLCYTLDRQNYLLRAKIDKIKQSWIVLFIAHPFFI